MLFDKIICAALLGGLVSACSHSGSYNYKVPIYSVSGAVSRTDLRVDGACGINNEAIDIVVAVVNDLSLRIKNNIYDQDLIDFDCIPLLDGARIDGDLLLYYEDVSLLLSEPIACRDLVKTKDLYRSRYGRRLSIGGYEYFTPEVVYLWGVRAERCGYKDLAMSSFFFAASFGYRLAELSGERIMFSDEVK